MKRWLLAFVLVTLMRIVAITAQQDEPAFRALAAAGALQTWYSERTGLWDRGIGGTNWWNSANALTALIDTIRATGTDSYSGIIANTFEANQARNFLNNLYDDPQWWALAWIDAYDLTGQERYLEMAKTIFEDTTGAWDDVCGGGVWWSRDRAYKNAITNELFMLLAVRLHQRTPGDTEYLEWAQREWEWFESSGMINEFSLINDGLNANCANNGDVTWTYNQGVILAALTDLYRVTGDSNLLDQAVAIANAAINRLITANGILREPCEPSNCGADGPQFKGIFIRHLAYLYEETQDSAYRDFIQRNAASIWGNARNDEYQLGLIWSGPFDAADASRQSSALDALNAAIPFADVPAPPPYQANLAFQAAVSSTSSCDSEQSLYALTDANPESTWCALPQSIITFELGRYYSISSVVTTSEDENLTVEYAALSDDGTAVWLVYNPDEPPVTNAIRMQVESETAIAEVEIFGEDAEQPVNTANLALNRPARGSSSCSPNELPAQAVDGLADTKWCSGATSNIYLQVDLGSALTVTRFIVRHAGSNGENPLWNTRDFAIEASPDGRTDWTTVVSVTDNMDSVTVHEIDPTPMRYVRLLILDPQTAADARATRIYDFEIYGE